MRREKTCSEMRWSSKGNLFDFLLLQIGAESTTNQCTTPAQILTS